MCVFTQGAIQESMPRVFQDTLYNQRTSWFLQTLDLKNYFTVYKITVTIA